MNNSIRSFLSIILGIAISKFIDYGIKKLNFNIPFYANIIFTVIIILIVVISINLIEKKIKKNN